MSSRNPPNPVFVLLAMFAFPLIFFSRFFSGILRPSFNGGLEKDSGEE